MPQSADLIVENASVLTMDPDTPRAEAIAISDGTIAAVGDRATVRDLKGPDTVFIDAAGKSVVPGFSASRVSFLNDTTSLGLGAEQCECGRAHRR